MLVGVPYDLFWTLNPQSLAPFSKAFLLRQRYDDRISWQNGLYIRMAIGSVLSKAAKYPEHPMLEDKKLTRQVMSPEAMKNKMMQFASAVNSRLGKENK